MRDITELSYQELEGIAEFIRKYVKVTRNYRYSFDTHIVIGEGKVNVEPSLGDEGEFIEGSFENFWCDKCESYIVRHHGSIKQAEATKLLFEHVMKHLGME